MISIDGHRLEEIVRRVVREELQSLLQRQEALRHTDFAAEEEPQYKVAISSADDDLMRRAMESMDATLYEQDLPKVGIFWYSSTLHDVFGVCALEVKTAPISGGGLRACKELHKNIWEKQNNYDKCHNIKGPFVGDYKFTPRGRIFYDEESDEFQIMVGKWAEEYPEAIVKIKEAFNLTDPNLCVKVSTGIHWEIGMGYGE